MVTSQRRESLAGSHALKLRYPGALQKRGSQTVHLEVYEPRAVATS